MTRTPNCWTEFPHQIWVDRLKMLFHPGWQIQIAFSREGCDDVIRSICEFPPPGLDLSDDDFPLVNFSPIVLVDKSPAHGKSTSKLSGK
jgi:hypothetical protein